MFLSGGSFWVTRLCSRSLSDIYHKYNFIFPAPFPVFRLALNAGIRIRIRSDSVIFGPYDPAPVHFSLDPDPTCYNEFINL